MEYITKETMSYAQRSYVLDTLKTETVFINHRYHLSSDLDLPEIRDIWSKMMGELRRC